ncbi:MAG: hypothetical protein QM689_11775 [Oscillospiraceae bacterium]
MHDGLSVEARLIAQAFNNSTDVAQSDAFRLVGDFRGLCGKTHGCGYNAHRTAQSAFDFFLAIRTGHAADFDACLF